MKIKQISVTGLFGIFDHVIPLSTGQKFESLGNFISIEFEVKKDTAKEV
jgi:hypothetical protein